VPVSPAASLGRVVQATNEEEGVMGRKMTPLSDRMAAQTDTTGGPDACWRWIGAVSDTGYGHVGLGGRGGGTTKAHRAAWSLVNGPIPAGTDICHRCDNRLCVNPSHLFAGSRLDNMRDAVSKGRQARGNMKPFAKFTPDTVRELRFDRDRGMTQAALAHKYGVAASSVQQIVEGRSWRHV